MAREILELHTLGVNGGYTQADVTTFAQIITGWSIGGGKGRLAGGTPGQFYFRDNLHEPGAEECSSARPITRAASARARPCSRTWRGIRPRRDFIATKLVRHFVADDPPPAAVERVARAFIKSGGDLPHVYAALIESPEAWDADCASSRRRKTSCSRRCGPLMPRRTSPKKSFAAFELLGQRQYTPGSPAGWPDTAKSWDGSDALMHRVLWASRVAGRYEQGVDPADLAAVQPGQPMRARKR